MNRTAKALGKIGATATFRYKPSDRMWKWRATVWSPAIENGYSERLASTLWGLKLDIRRLCRRVAKQQAMNFKAAEAARKVNPS